MDGFLFKHEKNFNQFNHKYAKSFVIPTALMLAALTMPSHLSAHGYVAIPESRAFLCEQLLNVLCGAVQYEPQSVEGTDRFPEGGPLDGQLASAGIKAFFPLDQLGVGRWWKNWVEPGPIQIHWQFTAPHSSRDFRYFITKDTWDPSQPLSRDQFELNPFCEVDFNNQRPEFEWNHWCDLPEREGYHIVLAVWDVADTVMSFYNVLDLYYKSPEHNAMPVAVIPDDQDLTRGAAVRLLLANADGPMEALNYEYRIRTSVEGQANVWPKLFAQSLNHHLPEWVRAGFKAADGIEPEDQDNRIFAWNPEVVSAKLSIVTQTEEQSLGITGLLEHYRLDSHQLLSLDLEFHTEFFNQLRIALIHDNQLLTTESLGIYPGATPWSMTLQQPPTGLYVLKIEWVDFRGELQRLYNNFEVWPQQKHQYIPEILWP